MSTHFVECAVTSAADGAAAEAEGGPMRAPEPAPIGAPSDLRARQGLAPRGLDVAERATSTAWRVMLSELEGDTPGRGGGGPKDGPHSPSKTSPGHNALMAEQQHPSPRHDGPPLVAHPVGRVERSEGGREEGADTAPRKTQLSAPATLPPARLDADEASGVAGYAHHGLDPTLSMHACLDKYGGEFSVKIYSHHYCVRLGIYVSQANF